LIGNVVTWLIGAYIAGWLAYAAVAWLWEKTREAPAGQRPKAFGRAAFKGAATVAVAVFAIVAFIECSITPKDSPTESRCERSVDCR
jgi:hypothetical protein